MQAHGTGEFTSSSGNGASLSGIVVLCCFPRDPLNTNALYEPCHRASRDIVALAAKLPPNLAGAIDPSVLFEDPKDLGAQRLVPARTIRQPPRIGPLGQMFLVGGRRDRQHAANRLDPGAHHDAR